MEVPDEIGWPAQNEALAREKIVVLLDELHVAQGRLRVHKEEVPVATEGLAGESVEEFDEEALDGWSHLVGEEGHGEERANAERGEEVVEELLIPRTNRDLNQRAVEGGASGMQVLGDLERERQAVVGNRQRRKSSMS